MKSTFSKRLSEIMAIRGKKQSEVSSDTKIPKSAISQYVSGKFEAKQDRLYVLAKYFDVSEAWLMGYDVPMDRAKEPVADAPIVLTEQEGIIIKKYRTLDEYGKELVTAVIDIEYKRCTYKPEPNRDELIEISINYAPVSAGLGDELEDYEHWEKVSVPLTPESRKADFILCVDGDSMEPKFSNGDYLLVRKQPAVDIGQIGIFDVDGKGYVKKYGGDKLISLNPKYKDISTTDDSRCFGLVLGTTDIIEE